MARIENQQHTINTAFRDTYYIVPDYQREYVWTDKEVTQLLDDINEQIDAGSSRPYFVGTVLVSPSHEVDHYEVIDGQAHRFALPVMQVQTPESYLWTVVVQERTDPENCRF